MQQRASLRWVAIALFVVVFTGAAGSVAFVSAQAPAKKPITHDVYDSWKSIRGTQVSRDGVWLVYALTPQDGDGELVARNLKTGAEHRHPRGQDPVITPDGRSVVFTIAPVKAEVDKAKKAKTKPEHMPKNGLGILTLESGAVATVDRVKSVKVPEESSRAVAYLMEPEKKPEAKEEKKKEKKHEPGTNLIVRDLATGLEATIAEVTEYVWTRDGTWLAYGVSAKAPENDGAFVRAADGTTRALLTGKGYYKGFAFDEKGTELATTTTSSSICATASGSASSRRRTSTRGCRPAPHTSTTSTTGSTTGSPTASVTASARTSPRSSTSRSRTRTGTRPTSRSRTAWRGGRPATARSSSTTATTSGR